MGITYSLYDPSTKRCIQLGKKDNSAFGYEGPIIFNGHSLGLLTSEPLFILKQRFIDRHGAGVVLLDTDVLYESCQYLQDDEDVIIVGGDEDNSIPLSEYLPELQIWLKAH